MPTQQIQITRNNNLEHIDQNQPLSTVLKHWGYQDKSFAVAINHEFIPRHRFNEIVLQEGDVLEIVTPMQGG